MDSTQHSLITPTTCFSVACVAFSLLAISAVWRNQYSATPSNKHGQIALQRRPKAIRRRGVDSLYIPPGEQVGFSTSEIDSKQPGRDEALAELVTLSAALAQQVRSLSSKPSSAGARHTTASLLGELSLLTTSLCRLQHKLQTNSSWLSQGGSGVSACFDATISSLKDSFSFLQEELCRPDSGNDQVVHIVLQQLRDLRPALEFLLENPRSSFSVSVFPPTPPCDLDLETPWDESKASGSSSLLPPTQAPTGLTPCMDAKAWIEPPPEYSPPAQGSSFALQVEKRDAKSAVPTAPPEQFATHSNDEDDDNTALYNAITTNSLSEVRTLLSQNTCNPSTPTGSHHRTPLHQAAHLNHISILSLLLRHPTISSADIPDSAGETPLHLASWAGHVESISILLGHGSSIDYLSGRDAYTPLWCAVSGCHLDAARLLITHGASAQSFGSTTGMTVLHQAAATGQADMCELLIGKGGVDVDARDEEGQTALHYASASGSVESVRILLGAGADVGAKQNGMGLTPAHWAAHKGHTEVLALLIEQSGGVLATKEPVGTEEVSEATPLHLAANRGHLPVVKLLLEKGAKRKSRAVWDGVEGTPTEMAKAKGHVRVAKVIETWQVVSKAAKR